jgi:hypothetical protein
MTGPPPCGPWCIAPTETKTARIAVRRRHHGADRRLGVAMVVHVGVVEHDLAPAAQGPAVVRLALDEAVDDAPAEVFGRSSASSSGPASAGLYRSRASSARS